MRVEEIEQFQRTHNVLNNQGSSTLKTIKSINEINPVQEYYFQRTILLVCILNSIIGIIILNNKSHYIISSFSYKNTLYYFIVIYTMNLLGSLIVSFFLSLLIYAISKFFCKKITINKKDKKYTIDNVSLIPYLFTIFILIDIIMYILGLPFSLKLLPNMIKDKEYSSILKYVIVYFFIIINSIVGIILVYVIIVMIAAKAKENKKQIKFEFDEQKLANITKEVNEAINKVLNRKKKNE